MSILESVYSAAVRSLQVTFPLLGRGSGKLARGIRGRSGALARMQMWSAGERRPDLPLVWFHAPSVGEGLQALAVLERLRLLQPDVQVVYTFFSPSAEGLARRVPADFADYLPIDTPAAVAEALDLLRPTVLVFSKTDVWPNLTREAARRGVGLAMISATLPRSSSRLRGPARALLKPAYGRLQRVAAISEEDSMRFGELGVPSSRRTVMGDAHFDRVLARAAATDLGSPLLAPLVRDEPVLVAGSTWGHDEERLIPALARLRGEGVPFAGILVPHEPTGAHLSALEQRLDSAGFPHVRLGSLEGPWRGPAMLIVDRVGVLGDLYGLAAVAYVGGGYGTAGIHSVLEPAAFGVPVVFGPNHDNAREASDLVAAEGAFDPGENEELFLRLRQLLEDDARRGAAGRAAREIVEKGRGAADRGADIVLALLAEHTSGKERAAGEARKLPR
jgi:3-deoxy-D-manno-octulosonic-acid transferase